MEQRTKIEFFNQHVRSLEKALNTYYKIYVNTFSLQESMSHFTITISFKKRLK